MISYKDELAVKYLENLAIEKISGYFEWRLYSICASVDFDYRLVIVFTQERTPRQTFTY